MVKVNLENPFLTRPKNVKIGRSYWQAQSKAPTILKQKDSWVKQRNDRKDRELKAFRKYLRTEGARALNKEVKDYLTTSNDNTWTSANRNPKNQHLQARVTKGAKAHASWEKEHPTLTKWGNVLGAAPFAVAAAPLAATAGSGIVALADAAAATSIGQGVTNFLAPIAGTSIGGASIPQWLDTGLTSAFGAHGIQTTIDKGEISPTTALEIAPLGRLAKPIYNTGKVVDRAVRYVSPSYDLYRSIGETPIIKKAFPIKSLYRADVYRGGKIRNPRNISLTTDPKYASQYGEVSPYIFESSSVAKAKEPLMGYSDPVNNDMFIYHNTKDVPGANAIIGHDLVTGEFPYNSKGTEIISLSPNNIYPKRLKPSTIEWKDAARTPQITADNAANITPEQWTIAQDLAIAKGDMNEAQRLRDLHFMIKAPNTFASINGKPLQLYHGTNNDFNAFDLSKYGSTDGGTFGRGVYTTPVQEYAQLYGKNNMPLYMKLDNPRDYREYSIGDLIAEKLAFGEDFSTGNGIDGVIGRPSWKGFKGLKEYVSHNPKNIKSSKAVTYDNKGVRIPLGKRDNFKLNDIRYGLIPFGVGLTGYGLFNNKKALGGSIPFYNPKRIYKNKI